MNPHYEMAEICKGLAEVCDMLAETKSGKPILRRKFLSRAKAFRSYERLNAQNGIDASNVEAAK